MVGGIHTPAAVVEALALGNAIGTFFVPVALASGHSCNGNYNGVFNGNPTVSAGQNCVFTSPCKIKGDVSVNGAASTSLAPRMATLQFRAAASLALTESLSATIFIFSSSRTASRRAPFVGP